MSIEAKCLAKLIPHRGNGAGSCNDCDGKPSKENVCCHFTPWNDEEKESLGKQDRLTMALTVLARVNLLLGEIIRDNLIEDTSIASELADDVWEVLHGDKWDEKTIKEVRNEV